MTGISPASFWQWALADPGAPALVCGDDVVTRGGLGQGSNRLVHAFRARGMSRGDGVAAMLPSGRALVELSLAAMQSGWQLTPINPHLAGAEVAYIVNDSMAKIFVGHERYARICAEVAAQGRIGADGLLAVGELDGFHELDDVVKSHTTTLPPDRVAGEFMHYTSGTTGRPKGVRCAIQDRSPEERFGAYTILVRHYGIAAGSNGVHLCACPLYHSAPMAWAMCALHLGHVLVVMDKWDAEQSLELIERHRVTYTHMVPTQFRRLLRLDDQTRRHYDLSSLTHVVHGAAPCPIEVKRQMLDWLGPVIYEYYAASEGRGTTIGPHEWLARPGTVGRPWPGLGIRIVGDDGNDLPPDEPGTVYLRLDGQVPFEYFNDPEKTAGNRRGDYFTAGDIGYLDEDGYLFLCGRTDEVIISGGVNIYPAEIEAALVTHPTVADAAVLGVTSEEWGEQAAAFIELVHGETPVPGLAEQLAVHCRESLAAFKCPRSVTFVESLPRDPSGKLRKHLLRQQQPDGARFPVAPRAPSRVQVSEGRHHVAP
jgi:long-chain acyl-CoA synthetase